MENLALKRNLSANIFDSWKAVSRHVKITHIQDSANYRVAVQTARVVTKVHQNFAQNTYSYLKLSGKIICAKKMKLFSINCQSYRTAKSNFNTIVDNYEIDILCLTETFESQIEPVHFRQWSKLSKPRKDGYGGVSILYRDDENRIVMERKQDLERDEVMAICAKVTTKKTSFLLITAYIPPEKKSKLKAYYQF